MHIKNIKCKKVVSLRCDFSLLFNFLLFQRFNIRIVPKTLAPKSYDIVYDFDLKGMLQAAIRYTSF